ncbi:ParB N-terminal domain-containing protein [Candidatus Sumerlaeota bacterium]|nr:ParB N-terminal domain-containing protein [Candidatus Sumerlaeota bacterium]
MNRIELTSLEGLTPASYNPRKVDPARLELVKLSLRKLGWLLPVYVAEGGEILSGHQRTFVARDLPFKHAPVVRLGAMPDHIRKAVNILFNRSTNDMDIDVDSSSLLESLKASNVYDLAEGLPDVDESSAYPCMRLEQLPLEPLLKVNSGRWIRYAANVAKSLYRHKIVMPVALDPDGVVVNGIGRLQMLAEKKAKYVECVRLSREQAEFARVMLNLLSMDFDIHTKYADLLRYNSFRRARRTRSELGRGFVFALIGNKPAHTFDIRDAGDRERWIKLFGRRVLDFGAGHLTETRMLRENGVDVTPFEPYRLGADGQIDKAESVALAREFLRHVAEGRQWRSIFISSVLNSVPFYQDRLQLVRICAALCHGITRVYAVASSDKQDGSGIIQMRKKYLNQRASSHAGLALSYEENVYLGDIQELPKVQKFHSLDEFYSLFKTAFNRVKVGYDTGSNVSAIAQGCAGFDGLLDALKFEFDLPYPDGSRMGLADEAVAAFEQRLKIKLN